MWPGELWITADFYGPAVEKLWLIAVGNQQPQRLDDGKIVGKGTHAELLKNCEVYREIAESQLSRAELESAVQTDGKEEKIHG